MLYNWWSPSRVSPRWPFPLINTLRTSLTEASIDMQLFSLCISPKISNRLFLFWVINRPNEDNFMDERNKDTSGFYFSCCFRATTVRSLTRTSFHLCVYVLSWYPRDCSYQKCSQYIDEHIQLHRPFSNTTRLNNFITVSVPIRFKAQKSDVVQ